MIMKVCRKISGYDTLRLGQYISQPTLNCGWPNSIGLKRRHRSRLVVTGSYFITPSHFHSLQPRQQYLFFTLSLILSYSLSFFFSHSTLFHTRSSFLPVPFSNTHERHCASHIQYVMSLVCTKIQVS